MPKVKRKQPIVSTHTVQPYPDKRAKVDKDKRSKGGHGGSKPHQSTANNKPKGTKHQPSTAQHTHPSSGQPSNRKHHVAVRKSDPNTYKLVCSSVVDRQAAKAMTALLQADSGHGRGATIKSLTLAPHISAKKATYAVTCQAMKHLPILRQIVSKSKLLQQPDMNKMSECTVYVLVYELLIGAGLHQRGPAERLVAKHKDVLLQVLQSLLKEAGVKSASQLLESQSGPEPPTHPRWVRVNTLRMTVEDAMKELKNQYPSAEVDDLLPDVVRLPHNTPLHAHPLVQSGALVMQSKASAMPAHALAPQPGWHCVDGCAAPGNKTTHLAAVMQGKGKVTAFDKDAYRLKRLEANAELTGANQVITARLQDFLSVETNSPEFVQVRGVLLDPSCSGSGTVVSRQDHLMPSWRAKQEALQRVRQRHKEMMAAHTSGQTTAAAAGVVVPTDGDEQAEMELEEHTNQQKGEEALDTQAEGSDGEEGTGTAGDEDAMRIQQLAKFQVAAVRHALTFPALERLVYSTCSIHAEENELVVQAVLPEAQERGFQLEAVFPSWHRRGLPYFDGCEKLVRTDPYEDDTDGFFVAVFQKQQIRQEQQDTESAAAMTSVEGAQQPGAKAGHKPGKKAKKTKSR